MTLSEQSDSPATSFTMEARLCDDDGMVSRSPVEPPNAFDANLTYYGQLNNLRRAGGHAVYEGDPFVCTGSAHLAGQHVRCTSPAHQKRDCPACRFPDDQHQTSCLALSPTDEQSESLAARYEELRHAAQEAVDARDWAIRYDHGEPDRPIMTMIRLSSVLKKHAHESSRRVK